MHRDQADSFKNFGRLTATLAAQNRRPLQQRIAVAREAITYYQRDLKIWDEWLAQGLAQPYAARKRNEALLRRLTVSTRH